MNKVLTEAGLEKLKKEQQALIEKRIELMEELEEARQMGDLAENSAYHSLKNQLTIIDNKLVELKQTIDNAQVVSQTNNSNAVGLGSTVKVDCGGKEKVFQIVGDGEADPLKGKISHGSPIAQSLLGKKKGERVKIITPGGELDCQILSIEN